MIAVYKGREMSAWVWNQFSLSFSVYFCRENTDLTRIRDAEREVASSKWAALIAAAEAKGVHLQV